MLALPVRQSMAYSTSILTHRFFRRWAVRMSHYRGRPSKGGGRALLASIPSMNPYYLYEPLKIGLHMKLADRCKLRGSIDLAEARRNTLWRGWETLPKIRAFEGILRKKRQNRSVNAGFPVGVARIMAEIHRCADRRDGVQAGLLPQRSLLRK